MALTGSLVAAPHAGNVRFFRRLTSSRREALAAYCFIGPAIVMFLVFTLGPAVFSLFVGFTRWDGLSTPVWVGLQNYIQLAGDGRFLASLRNTALFTLMFVVICIVTSTLLAVLLNRKVGGTPIVRFLWLLPFLTDMVSVSMVWTWLYHFRFGVINYLLGLVGIPPQAWLGDSRLALFSLVILSVWRWTGYYAIIILAGLQNISTSLYEAAVIDGATSRQTTLRITLPLLTPTIFFVIVTAMMSSFQVFEQMWVMTQGGPDDATISVAMYLYIQGFQLLHMGYASAVAWVLFLIVFIITVFNWKIRSRWVFEG
jgi:multiple sugar transport system permease protein